MAGEGVFPKSAGDVAYASEANAFHRNDFALSAMLAMGLDGATMTTQTNYSTESYTDGLANLGIGDAYQISLDTSDWTKTSGTLSANSSDGIKWTSGVNNDSNYLQFDNDIFTNSNYIETKITLDMVSESGGTRYVRLILTDGSNEAVIKSVDDWDQDDTSAWRFHKDGTDIHVWDDGVAESDVDITGWGSDIYIKFQSRESGAGGTMTSEVNVYYLFETDDSFNYVYTTGSFTTATNSISATDDEAIILVAYLNVLPTIEMSFDNGSNYTTISNKTKTKIANLGTTAKARFSWTGGTFTYTDSTTHTIPKVEKYAYYYADETEW